jgi:transmembrane sensor
MHNVHPDSDAGHDAPEIDHAAATWVLRRDRGLTGAEQDEFSSWLAADPRHGEAFARHRHNWNRLDLLAQWRPEHSRQPNRDLLAPPPRRLARVIPLLFAAAAVVAIGVFALRRTPSDSATPAPEIAARVVLPPAIERRTLEDGSVVELNRGAEIAVQFTEGERRVELSRGEAHFTVAKNPARPFIVSAAGVSVRAVGTAFNVRLDSAVVEVLVTEGSVQVEQPAEPALVAGPPAAVPLLPTSVSVGEHAIISLVPAASAPQAVAVTPQQVEALLAWQPRMLDFSATPLADIVAEFNRHNQPVRLVVDNAALAATPLSASLRSDNLEGFVRMLEKGIAVQAERSGDTVVLRPPPSR